ncbi:M20/M25/M40 family metallo-hydrolase [Dissulfurimicrobium hydrothermale]|uniref:M20/M25/M40 family metallo-hydrolase n=1 Tax=Dissulfurimicrobium hydrothermale TaxID=1750598 RepID=UPI001EDAE272|nr:M20/M25/M40 family metallo-hydrolase [Dissulfurimicrobium hydrothermale]UKL14524.1 M20/M25/M40 family metallo-hydrolase [Dissulfurimicrobium hydrothermale]
MRKKEIRPDLRRLSDTFMELVKINSPSREEAAVCAWLRRHFSDLGFEVIEDKTKSETGSSSGNLIVRTPGVKDVPPLFFNAHMDTVEPGRGIKPIFKEGVFSTDGSTILGSDDKAAIAILIEVANLLKEYDVAHGPVEFLFTVCEEIGLLGAKAFDPALLKARAGYALDATNPDMLITMAPAAIRFHLKVVGKAVHAGIRPEDGINAIRIAANALSTIPMGRIDDETTANIGVIRGGNATNIVPGEVEMDGEVRSHSPKRLREVEDEIIGRFHKVASEFRKDGLDGLPLVQAEVRDDYPAMSVPDDHQLVKAAMDAARVLGRDIKTGKTGGGSDANIFNGKGLSTVIMGIGMQNVHSTSEFIRLEDMARVCRLVIEIIKSWPGC